jgi:hypothetical protein
MTNQNTDDRAVEAVAEVIREQFPFAHWTLINNAARAAISAYRQHLEAEGWNLEPPPTVFGHTSLARWNRENPQPVPDPPYGYCPHCGSPGVKRERRPNGDDTCSNGHKYPSASAMIQPHEEK